MSVPPLARVRQSVPQPQVADIAGTVRRLILDSRLRERVPAGGRIAVGARRLGDHRIPTVATSAAAVDALKEMGFKPFIVAAMGSHGGSTSAGQRELLAGYGVTPEAMDVEVRSDMDTVVLGTNPVGLPIYFDKNAHEADGIVLLNRVKPHTDFTGTYESGVLKMLVIGLGKRAGARRQVLQELGLARPEGSPCRPSAGVSGGEHQVFLGLAILENAADMPAEIVPCARAGDDPRPPSRSSLEQWPAVMAGGSPSTRSTSSPWGELGKNYSGAGMDPNVHGRLMVETQPDFARPVVTRLVVLDASEESHGNIVGVGFADLTTDRLVATVDPDAFRINVLTSCCLERARIPIALPTDRDVFDAAIATCWRIDPSEARIVVIPNTLELNTMYVSPALDAEVAAHPHLTRETDYEPAPIGLDGNLDQEAMFPESVRGRRAAGAAYAAHLTDSDRHVVMGIGVKTPIPSEIDPRADAPRRVGRARPRDGGDAPRSHPSLGGAPDRAVQAARRNDPGRLRGDPRPAAPESAAAGTWDTYAVIPSSCREVREWAVDLTTMSRARTTPIASPLARVSGATLESVVGTNALTTIRIEILAPSVGDAWVAALADLYKSRGWPCEVVRLGAAPP